MTSREDRSMFMRQHERGFVIVAVLWILAALASLAMVFSAYLSNSAHVLATNDTALQGEALISSSVELTAYQLSLGDEKARPATGRFQYRLSGAEILVSFASEAARVDLNAAPKELLVNLLTGLGAEEDAAKGYADRIVAWRTRATGQTAENETALYRAAGLAYAPRQAPFAHVDELSLVLGLPAILVDRMLLFVTVFSGSSGIDALIAPPEVVAALPGMTPLVLKDFLNSRSALPRDNAALATALGPAKAGAELPTSKAYRIVTTIRFGNGNERSSEVVIGLGGKDAPYRVLSWREERPRRSAKVAELRR
ncbi:general secretion pathway protein GspK [Bradyrhizobium sp. WD16]|uniref:general secretion pathway protein GspK n=1 Tax=Bradyrhizobium sp. WD16 TaxID=1521768 RepID=UPI0020A4AC70|nr:type II secretion system protein GspK [Bradyrhizobium sp. WD16]UTD28131.1 general secretion pathway protein GspK [Bradyrhizobium sp. WD16]